LLHNFFFVTGTFDIRDVPGGPAPEALHGQVDGSSSHQRWLQSLEPDVQQGELGDVVS
jgi:hypothetical protein